MQVAAVGAVVGDDLRSAPVHRSVRRAARQDVRPKPRCTHLFGGERHGELDRQRSATPVGGIIQIR